MSRFLTYACAAALLAACGDPVADAAYRGEPRIRIAGRLEGDAQTSSIRAPYIGIVWLVYDFYSNTGTGRLVTSVVPVPDATFPGDFRLDLYDPPPPEAFGEFFGVRYAIGAIVALDDVDGDHAFSLDPTSSRVTGADRFFGASFWYQLLLYVDRVDDADCARAMWANPEALVPGTYQLASLDECLPRYTVLPQDTPIRLILFPTEAGLPDTPPNYVEPDCEDEILLCETNPSDPLCRSFESGLLCQHEACGWATAAYDACMDRHCLQAVDFETCSSTYCGAEDEAMLTCLDESCSGSDLCRYF